MANGAKRQKPLTFQAMRREIKFRRLVRWPTKWLHQLLPRGEREVVRHGIHWRLQFKGIEGSIVKKARWEQEQIEFFFGGARMRGCGVFLDVGSHIGYYSMLAAKMKIFREIHAVEAWPGTFSRLQWHIRANRLEGVVCAHEMAASDAAREMMMTEGMCNLPGQTLIADGETAEGKKAAVKTAPLDSLFNFAGECMAVKMDIEGHEIPALRGAEKLLAQNRVFLQIEVWPQSGATVEYLLGRGFRLIHYIGNDFYFENRTGAAEKR